MTPIDSNLIDDYIELAQQSLDGAEGSDRAQWINRLEEEHANLREVFNWLIEQGDAERGLRLAYRRQGIATALKVHSISQAKADGVRRIDTNNDENNPMLELNLKLGFQHGPAELLYEKLVD